jgi:hypothetical protein
MFPNKAEDTSDELCWPGRRLRCVKKMKRTITGIIIIVCVLAISCFFQLIRFTDIGVDWKMAATLRTMEQVRICLEDHLRHNNQLPHDLSVLTNSQTRPSVTNSLCLLDSWGYRLIYDVEGTNYCLRSVGSDGKCGTRDDIVINSPIRGH